MIVIGGLYGLVFLPVVLSYIGEVLSVLLSQVHISLVIMEDGKEYESLTSDPKAISSLNDDISSEVERSTTKDDE